MTENLKISQDLMKWIISFCLTVMTILLGVIAFFAKQTYADFKDVKVKMDHYSKQQQINTNSLQYLLRRDQIFEDKFRTYDQEWTELYKNYNLEKRQ